MDIQAHAESLVEFHPLRIQPDGDEYLVGRPEVGSFLAMDRSGLEALEHMREGHTLGRIKRELAQQLNEPEVQLGDFLEQLLNARLVRRIDDLILDDTPVPISSEVTPSAASHRLCSRTAVSVYALLVLAAVALVVGEPGRYLVAPTALFQEMSYPVATLVTLLIGWGLVAKHEAAHLVAARAAGVPARVTLGHRLLSPVLQTDLTALWSVPRSRRFPVYLAGIVSDVLVAALAVVVLAGLPVLGLVPAPVVVQLLQLTVLLGVAVLLWQTFFFLRTDVYFALADLLRCRNLHEDAWCYLRSRLRVWLGRAAERPVEKPSRREMLVVRAYALIMVGGAALYLGLFAVYAVSVVIFVTTGTPLRTVPYAQTDDALDRATAGLLFGLVTALVAISIVRARRRQRRRPRYRLIAPPGL